MMNISNYILLYDDNIIDNLKNLIIKKIFIQMKIKQSMIYLKIKLIINYKIMIIILINPIVIS